MSNKMDNFLKELAELGQLQMRAEEENRERINTWWESLDPQTQQDAFYAVVQRIHQGDIEDRGTYRYVLYDVFGWGPEAYGMGMACGYLNVHNMLYRDAIPHTSDATPEPPSSLPPQGSD